MRKRLGCGISSCEIVQIDRRGGIDDYDVVLKSVPSTPFLSLRSSFDSMDEVVPMVRSIAEEGNKQINPAVRDKLIGTIWRMKGSTSRSASL